MARKKRTPKGTKPNQSTDAENSDGPRITRNTKNSDGLRITRNSKHSDGPPIARNFKHSDGPPITRNTKQATPTKVMKTESTKTKKRKPIPNANLRSIRRRPDKKDTKQYTKFVENFRKPEESGSGRRPTRISSSDLSRPRPKALRAFTQLVDTVQEVAVVDVRPGLQVDFTKLSKKKPCHYMQVEKRMSGTKSRINRVMESAFLPPAAKGKAPNPDDNMRDPTNKDVFIVDMPASQKQGTNAVFSANLPVSQPHDTKPRAAKQSAAPKENISSLHQLPIGNFKQQKTRSSPRKPNHQDELASTSSNGNNVTSSLSNQQPHPLVAQFLKVHHKEPVSADSSGVSSRSEMESEVSETEYMSAESGDEIDTSARTPGGQGIDQEDGGIYGATYDRNKANVLPNTYPMCSVAIIQPLSYLPFLGQVKMSVLHGKVKVHGYIADVDSDPVPLYSSQSAPALRIETSEEMFKLEEGDEASIQELKQRLSQSFKTDYVETMTASVLQEIQECGASVVRLEQHWSDRTAFVTDWPFYKDLFMLEKKWAKSKSQQRIMNAAAEIGFYPIKPGLGFKILTAPPVYDEATNPILDFLDQGRKPIVMICGWKNVGKSTYARYLVNSMLNKTDAICYLDCDVGQTEFNPPALMGITKVTKPLLGPPFTNRTEPERMCFFGETSPGSSPSTYCEAVRQLLQYYTNNLHDLPLVVNCYGWMKGLGLSILVDSIRLIQPSHILQLLPTPRPKHPPILNKEYLHTARGWSRVQPESRPDWDLCHMLLQMPWETDEGRRYKGPHQRELSLTAYMGHLMPTNFKFDNPLGTYEPLTALKPYSVPWGSVGVHVCNAEVPVSQLMYALNASVVGLCTADERQMMAIDFDDSDNLPKVFQSTPVCQCHGLGIIRGIDPIHKMFYILTHLPESTLHQVNTLMKGSISLPQFLMQQDEKCEIPYVTCEFPHDVTGTSSIKVLHMTPKYRFRRSEND